MTALSACSSYQVERLWLKAPGWSRAQLIDDTPIQQAVPIALDDAGGIYIFSIQEANGAHHPHVIALNRLAEVVWKCTIKVALVELGETQIHWDGKELVLFWLDEQSLYGARVDMSGSMRVAPTLLSGETVVNSFDVASDSNGSISVWHGGTRHEPGVYTLLFGDSSGERMLVDAKGIHPTVQYDHEGTLHAAWYTYLPLKVEPLLYYATYPDSVYRPEQQSVIAEVSPARSNNSIEGPWLAFDQKRVYLFSIEFTRTSRRAGLADLKYAHFPSGDPEGISDFNSIAVPRTNDLVYETLPEEGLIAGQRASLMSGEYPRLVSPIGITINKAAEPELALALKAQIPYLRNDTRIQVGTLFLQDGALTTCQLLSFTPQSSLAPAIASDGARQLYLTWIERTEDMSSYHIYLASTASDIRQTLDLLTMGDVGRMAADTFFGLLQGAVYSLFAALIWLAAPALLLALTWRFRRDGHNLVSRPSLISIGLALIAYWVGKLTTFASAYTYVPFSAWIPVIPSWLNIPLQLGVPTIIAVVALRAAWHYTERSATRSAALFVAIYAGVDGLFTMAVYSGLLYGAF